MDVQKSSKLLAVGRWLMVGGLATALAGGVFAVRDFGRSRHKAHADAVVSELEPRTPEGGEIVYFPHFRYRLPSGAVVDAVGKVGDNPAPYQPGDAVRVAYRPENPKDVAVGTLWAEYRVGFSLLMWGIAAFDLGVVLWWWGRRRAMKRGAKPENGAMKKQFAALFGRAGGYRSGER